MNKATPSEPYNAAKASETAQRVGKRVEALGRSVRETLSPEGAIGGAAASAANTLEGTGAYLQETNLESMVEDFTGLLRRYPLQSLLIGFGVGYLLARNAD